MFLLNKFLYKKSFGFTLAEVLIVLGVIGIVAEMTIPNLIYEKQKQELTTQLKAFFTNFNQALLLMSQDLNCPGDLSCTGVFDNKYGHYRNNSIYVLEVLSKYIKTDKICGKDAPNAGDQGCFRDNGYKLLNGETATSSNGFYELNNEDRNWATLQNGVFYGILNWADDGFSCSSSTFNYCALLYVDINGAKGPNKMGRDVFYFNIMPNAQLSPSSGQNPTIDLNDCTTSGRGKSCSCSIIKNSWQMNY